MGISRGEDFGISALPWSSGNSRISLTVMAKVYTIWKSICSIFCFLLFCRAFTLFSLTCLSFLNQESKFF